MCTVRAIWLYGYTFLHVPWDHYGRSNSFQLRTPRWTWPCGYYIIRWLDLCEALDDAKAPLLREWRGCLQPLLNLSLYYINKVIMLKQFVADTALGESERKSITHLAATATFQKEEELSLAHSKPLLCYQLKLWSMKFGYLYHRWVLLTSSENGRQIFPFSMTDMYPNKLLFWKLLHGKASVTYLSVFV